MEPTLFSDDVVMSDHLTPKLTGFRKGDIIVARSPQDPKMFVCKRIVALPGDSVFRNLRYTVSCVSLEVYINCLTIQIVPKGHVWVEGDNKHNSTDSNMYGPIPIGLIRGRLLFRIYPFDEWKLFQNFLVEIYSDFQKTIKVYKAFLV